MSWQAVPGADVYATVKRRTDEAYWDHGAATLTYLNGPSEPAAEEGRVLTNIQPHRGDDWLFGVQSCNVTPEGSFCSPVSSAVPGGAFEPVEQPD